MCNAKPCAASGRSARSSDRGEGQVGGTLVCRLCNRRQRRDTCSFATPVLVLVLVRTARCFVSRYSVARYMVEVPC